MSFYPDSLTRQAGGLVALLGLALTASCSAVSMHGTQADVAPQGGQELATESSVSTTAPASDRGVLIPTPSAQPSPQLIKNASLQLKLANVDEAIATISDILTQYQGDLLQLSDQAIAEHEPRYVTLQLRVPQANLESTLKALRELGTVENQSITAEDVSTQLVDLQARIRNLRKSEAALLEIMERSGSIADVLEVNRELSTVREAIERNAAQLESLQNRVAYSTITLTLLGNEPAIPSGSPIGETLGDTWKTSTAAVRSLSVSLLQLTLWLLVFSPYIGLLVLIGWGGHRYWRNHRTVNEPTHEV